MARRGFTVVEIIIVLAISALFSALAITYSSVGRNQVALTVEEAKLAQFILQAKSLAISTYTGSSPTCGYGVKIDVGAQKYSVFAYGRSAADKTCSSAANIKTAGVFDPDLESLSTPGTWQVPVAAGVKIQQTAGQVMTILFYPPDPVVFLSPDEKVVNGTNLQPGPLSIVLETVDGQNQATITVSPGGQVSL